MQQEAFISLPMVVLLLYYYKLLPRIQYYKLSLSTNTTSIIIIIITITNSKQGGETWSMTSAPPALWAAIASDSSGRNLAAVKITGTSMYTSTSGN